MSAARCPTGRSIAPCRRRRSTPMASTRAGGGRRRSLPRSSTSRRGRPWPPVPTGWSSTTGPISWSTKPRAGASGRCCEGFPVAEATRLGVSYFGNRYPHHAREDLWAMAATGASFVVHVMSEADLRWNPGTMAELVEIGNERRLQPWLTPWAVGGIFGGESASYAVGEHPGACQRTSDGRHLPALCPRQPVFRSLIEAWIDAAAVAGAEVVQWDELHLALPYRGGATPWACRCDACQGAFLSRFGKPMPGSVTPDVETFLDDLLTDTLAWMVDAARIRGLDSSIVLLANESFDPALWGAAASLPGVRYFGTTAFWLFYGILTADMESYLSLRAERVLEATTGTDAEPMGWVQAFGVPGEREAEVERAIEILRDTGVTMIAVWSYLACVAMSGLAPDDPAAVWAAVERGFDSVAHQAE